MRVRIRCGGALLDEPWSDLRRAWSETSYRMRRLRDDPQCAEEEFAAVLDAADPGLSQRLSFDPQQDIAAPLIARGARPRVAVLREQGVNSQIEMAAVLDRAGFEAARRAYVGSARRRAHARGLSGLVACGGFSYGDVLGAGGGWARSILFHERTRREFERFFARGDTFSLGVCNGCQMFALLKELIPGRAALAALPAQSQRAVRGALQSGADRRLALGAAGRHAGLAPAGGGRARRGPAAVRVRGRSRSAASSNA